MTDGLSLVLLFNHSLTDVQEHDARQALGVSKIVMPPAAIQELWSQVPAEEERLKNYLAPVLKWLEAVRNQGDYVLVQGEFGASWIAVNKSFELGLIPIYSTSKRQAEEDHLPGGNVEMRHLFSHVRFRRYER